MTTKPTISADWQYLDTHTVLSLLPHRYPILLVDRAYVHPHDCACLGIKNLTVNEPVFQGHFPNEPLMPGVYLIEAIAQTAALAVLIRHPHMQGRSIYLLGVEQARFRQKVLPGDRLEIYAWLDRQRGSFLWFRGRIWVDDRVVAEARISTSAETSA